MLTDRTLSDSQSMPRIGLGTYTLNGELGVRAMASALVDGYRLIDTAFSYRNEPEVGRAVRESGVARHSIHVTSKLPRQVVGSAEATEHLCRASFALLGVGAIDSFLIHGPAGQLDANAESWRVLIDLKAEGLVRSIGVSNFSIDQIDALIDATGVPPALNQIEVHPYFPQTALRGALEARGITVEAWSPLGNYPPLLEEAAITSLAGAHLVTPAQLVMKWHAEIGTIPIPRSSSPERRRENLALGDWTLNDAELEAMRELEIPNWNRWDYFDPR